MNKFTPEEVDAAASETESFRVYCGDFNVADMLRAFAARLREADENAKDAARFQWISEHALTIDLTADPDNLVCIWHGKDGHYTTGRTLREAIDAAMREQGEG